MMKEGLHRIQTAEKDQKHVIESVKPVLAYVIGNTPQFTKTKTENVVFYIESVFYEQFGERLTEVEWQIKKSRVTTPIIQTVLSEWIEENRIETTVENNSDRFMSDKTTYYEDMDTDTSIKQFIHDNTQYTPTTKPYSCIPTQTINETGYHAFAKFIDTTLHDLQADSNNTNEEPSKESDNWIIFEPDYTRWLEQHPMYPHETRFDNYCTFENWDVETETH